MQIFFCILIFMMGTVFGSFFTLAVYRIPLNKNILYERSFCPKCNHKLEFLDLIPVLSYIFLRGKCRYCGEKVRIRYLILEVLSGLVFLIAYLSLKMVFPFFDISKLIYFIAFIMFYITIILISGIDKEYFMVDKRVLLFGLTMHSIYVIYIYMFEYDFYIILQYLALLVFEFLTLFIDTILLKKVGESKYFIQVLSFIIYVIMFLSIKYLWIFIILSLLLMIFYKIYIKIKFNLIEKPDILQELPTKQIPVVFCIGFSSIVTVIVSNFIVF